MSSIESVLQFLSTVRYLQSQQITGQAYRRVKTLFEKPEKFYSQQCPKCSGCKWSPKQEFLAPGPQNNSSLDILAGQFSFLNRKQDIGWPPNWSCNNLPKLWQYNLHYFEWLWALDFASARDVTRDWIKRQPLARGQVGWDPYPISLRLMNWLGLFCGKFRKETELAESFLDEMWRSVYLQSEWLARHLETHLLGNHLFENGAALAFVGSCFDGPAAKSWFELGKSVLVAEIPEQVLPDGMHFELSPMYHCRMTYLMVLLLATGNEELCGLVEEPLTRMLDALVKVCHPDGQIALLNDSAFGVYNEPSQLLATANELLGDSVVVPQLAPGPWALPDAGYYGFNSGDGTYIICDAGAIGPDYIPGHAHGDIFSFELSLNGHRVIVDSGVHDYLASDTRRYCRSTHAHNTVEIEGQDQCEFWGAFRVARRGRPHDVKWTPADDGFQLSGWHDGYCRLQGAPRHYREFSWRNPRALEIIDRVSANRPVCAVSRLHLAPSCRLKDLSGDRAIVACSGVRFRIKLLNGGSFCQEETFYCSEFGRKASRMALARSFSGTNAESRIEIELL